MNYQVLDVKVKDTEETAKLYTYFLDNSREIAPERVRPVIVICPGGGYEWVSEREAEPIALKFVGAGYHAVVLHYSVAPAAHYPTALRQLAWTVAHLREHAAEYHIDPNKVVVAGFSAGGHLAASYGVFWKKKTFLAEELGVDAEQLRPNGLLLSYPVITSGPKAHRGSFTNLLGDRYDELVDEMSLENQVSLDTPKTFLWHTAPDDCVPVENSILFKKAYVGNNCVIKNSIILNDVYIGDNTVIENCIVESRDTIRANTTYIGTPDDIKIVIEKNERYTL